ncbi:hypothetical protein TNCV_3683611 [Trichonephila clavipes]|nr:hypothetical protein TNCV_3683611 [Trichonephila clavipes]
MATGSYMTPIYSRSQIIEEILDLARQTYLEVDSDDIQEGLDPHKQELTIDVLLEMHEQKQGMKQAESLDPAQSEHRMTVGNLTEGLNLIDKRVNNFRYPTTFGTVNLKRRING